MFQNKNSNHKNILGRVQNIASDVTHILHMNPNKQTLQPKIDIYTMLYKHSALNSFDE